MFINYIALDLEAIAVNRGFDEIIEIGAVRIRTVEDRPGTEEDSFSLLVRPCFHDGIPKKVTKITGITNEDMVSAESFDSAFEKFKKWAGKDPTFVAWGMQDQAWVRRNCRAFSIPHEWLTENYIDMQRLYRTYMRHARELPSLESALQNENITMGQTKAHRALPDAVACARIFNKTFPHLPETRKEVL